MTRRVTNGLDLANRPIINVGDPASSQDAATKNYVDAVIRGLDWKPEVVAASTGNVNVSSPGTSIDGITLTNGDRVLLKDQTAPAQNGIWVFNGAAAAMTRAPDADTGPELSGSTVTVQRGTVNADRVYRVSTDDPITVDTTSIAWVQVGGAATPYQAGDGLTLTGSTFDVGAGDGILVDADAVRVDPAVVARKAAASVGNGVATSFSVVHNFGSRDVQVSVFDNSTFEDVLADVVRTDNNTVSVSFATPPSNGAYRVVVYG